MGASSILGMEYTERRVSRSGHELYVRDHAGESPAFVLMHGFPDNSQIYDEVAPKLAAAGRRVVTFDFLGYGKSDKPSEYLHSAYSMVGDLDAVVEGLGLSKVVLVAHDASGPTAINWALDNREKVAGIALMNVYYDSAPTLRFPEMIRLFADPEHREIGRALIDEPAQLLWLAGFQGRQFTRDAPEELRGLAGPKLLSIMREQFAATPGAGPAFLALTGDLRRSVAENERRKGELAGVEFPVRLIWGAGDRYLNIGVAQHLKGLFSNAEIAPLMAGHWPQIDKPAEVANSLLHL
ncbi:alpha/beta fold hydrolase [Bradyrhizobium sp. CCBAU 51745]|uniref:alpha/beta fold hydrolase n=1 Tax=Bradyrhizobium sp. CCBAU 51745 TaxID=1325099 RepID=UPI002305442A|nr:alpha/beta hydrolase [Bradyrhizobium sp. CCBAU 51745]